MINTILFVIAGYDDKCVVFTHHYSVFRKIDAKCLSSVPPQGHAIKIANRE